MVQIARQFEKFEIQAHKAYQGQSKLFTKLQLKRLMFVVEIITIDQLGPKLITKIGLDTVKPPQHHSIVA
jgi:hypothetical protein